MALLLSAVCGVLLVVLAGAARISQLRTVARRHRRADLQPQIRGSDGHGTAVHTHGRNSGLEPLAPAPTAPEQTAPPPTAPAQTTAALPQHRIRRTRISGLWVSVGFFAVVLLLLLIFILQNGTKVDISYMGAHGRLPLGVALLLSAVCGVLLVVLAGAARISQLRTVARRHRRADAKRLAAAEERPVLLVKDLRDPPCGLVQPVGGVSGVSHDDPRHPWPLTVPGQRLQRPARPAGSLPPALYPGQGARET